MRGRRRSVSKEAIRVVRVGPGANCSSIGSVIDTLFVTALAGGAVFAAICAALDDEPIRMSDAASHPPVGDVEADGEEEEEPS